jgi:hypothetical protein
MLQKEWKRHSDLVMYISHRVCLSYKKKLIIPQGGANNAKTQTGLSRKE